MRRTSIGIALLALSHLAFANVSSALAQAGSIGGTIGNQDKTISGGEEVDRPRAAPHPKRPATKSQERSSGRSCDRIVGNWTWYLGLTETVFNQDGTGRNSGASATWTCSGGERAVVRWHGGMVSGAVDRVTISHDGNSLTVLSQLNGGTTFTATRRTQN